MSLEWDLSVQLGSPCYDKEKKSPKVEYKVNYLNVTAKLIVC